ncbi:telomere repeats-binding bouquet formation protein 1 [Chelmon rostratus]|uniref:telomere repeats-binding bouquet formation protein 1 n=1 Tax=Chelmon rostratus TaxID=109905 RepID=UPI001BECC761|nr:telomere repeats-binding bouquet formation protein 1 [Chelmon rostratus]
MDKTVVCTSRNADFIILLSAIRTDLSLLLECLKFQMKCPDLQKQALLTIHSICEKREDTVDMLREMGGVAFLYNLAKSSIVHSDVKETALFTLGTLAEASVYCKNSLCRKETFADIAGWLMKEDIPLTHKRVCVYLLSVLVSNNKLGQTLAQTTSCLDILLDLFKTTFPLSTEATLRAVNATQTYQLWASVSGALCGCVNNPQCEEAQRICVSAFPIIEMWLQQIALPRTELFQPICSFIAMTVANNSCVQENFSASGGLDTLTLALVQQASAADTSLLSCQLSVIISKTLSACITDNSALASGLAQYGMVSHLFSLLASPHLDPEDRLSVLITLCHCTEASEEHQSQLVQCGGLPLIITLLTEDPSEEVRKAATFVLQTCKQATMSLGVLGMTTRQGQGENLGALTNLEGFRSSARELLHRIDMLERRQTKAVDAQVDTDPSASTEGQDQPSVEIGGGNNIKLHTVRDMIKSESASELKNMSSNINMQEVKANSRGGDVWCSVCKGTGALMSSQLQSLEGGRELHSADNQLFKPPAPVRHSVPKEIECTDEEGLENLMSKVGQIPVKQQSLSPIRCAGCVLPFEEVTSRTFASLQSSCHHSCDMHKALQEATERFRTHHLNLLFRRKYQDSTEEQAPPDSETAAEPRRSWKNWREVCLTPIHKGAGRGKSSLPEHTEVEFNGITLTPLHREAKKDMSSHTKTVPGLTPLKRSHLPEERRGRSNSGHHAFDDELKTSIDHCSTRRKRKDFSREEVRYLLWGVKTFGFSWNSILWSYPFKPGRTNVGLAKKYRQLMKGKAQDAGCA